MQFLSVETPCTYLKFRRGHFKPLRYEIFQITEIPLAERI